MYPYSYQSTHVISGLAAGGAWDQIEVRLKMTIEWTQRYTPRPWSSEFGDALAGCDWVNLEMHSEIVIERVWLCPCRPWLCELGGRNRASVEMHLEAVIERVWRYTLRGHDRGNLEAVIERVWRCTWRARMRELRNALGGRVRASLEMHLQPMIEQDWSSTWRRSMGGSRGGETLFIGEFTHNRGNVTGDFTFEALMESWPVAVDHVGRHAGSWSYMQGSTRNHENEGKTNNLGWMPNAVYAVLGVCCNRCMLYLVSTHDHSMERCRGMT